MWRYRLRGFLFLTVLFIFDGAAAEQTSLLVDVTVNYRHQGVSLLLTDSNHNYFASTHDLKKWGVRGPYRELFEHQGSQYSSLSSLGDIDVELRLQQRQRGTGISGLSPGFTAKQRATK